MSKTTKSTKSTTKLPAIRATVVVGIARALRDSVSKTAALRVRVIAFRSEYGKNAVKLLGQLRKAVCSELKLNGKDKATEARWNTYRVLLARVCREAGVSNARKAAATKRVPLVSKATARQLVAALEAKGYTVSIKK